MTLTTLSVGACYVRTFSTMLPLPTEKVQTLGVSQLDPRRAWMGSYSYSPEDHTEAQRFPQGLEGKCEGGRVSGHSVGK